MRLPSSEVSLSLNIEINAPCERVFTAATDWNRQGEWIFATRVSGESPPRVGSKLQAFSGVGPIGFLDTMEISVWEPPKQCDVLHTGRVVRGSGSFRVKAIDNTRSIFTWEERVIVPFGAFGRLTWLLIKPLIWIGVSLSLRRFAHWAEKYHEA